MFVSRERVQALSFENIYTKEEGRPSDLLMTQMELIRSRTVLERAVADLETQGVLDFQQAAADSTPESRRLAYVAAIAPGVSVRAGSGNGLLAVAVRHRNPETAAALANAIAEAYLKNDQERLRRSADQAVAWLSQQVREQRDKLMNAEEKLRQFAGHSAPSSAEVGELGIQELSGLQQALLDVRLRLLQAETQNLIQGGSLGHPGAAGDLDAQVQAALRERVQKELLDTSVSLSQLRQRLGERHPDVQAAAEKERQLREQLAGLGRASAGAGGVVVGDEVSALRRQEARLRSDMDKAMRSSTDKGQAGLQYEIQRREVEINRSLYNEMLGRLNEITISSGLDRAPADIFEPARPPLAPISPVHSRTLALGLLAGCVLGLLGAAVRDHLDQSVRDPAQAHDLLKAPVLGMIPFTGRPKLEPGNGRAAPGRLAAGDSLAAESYRILRSHIEGAIEPADGFAFLVTSAVPGEGKTTTAANLACAFADAGQRVLLVDGDLRRPSLGRFFEIDPEASLGEVLSGSRPAETVIRPTAIANLDVLGNASGAVVQDGGRLTQGFRTLFEWARGRYDRVIVDMPIVMLVPGVVDVARAGARALLVHRPGWVPAQVLQQVREHLALSRAVLTGVILNGVRADWASGRYPILSYGEGERRPVPRNLDRGPGERRDA